MDRFSFAGYLDSISRREREAGADLEPFYTLCGKVKTASTMVCICLFIRSRYCASAEELKR